MNKKTTYIIIPSGGRFMRGISKTYLQQCHRTEKDPKARDRLLAYAMRKDGLSIRQIGARLNRPYSTIRDWLVRAVGRGMMGRYDEARPGPPCKLDAAQLARLVDELTAGPRSCGFESGVWTAPLVVEHVRRRYGVRYAVTSMYDLLRRIGFSCKKPRPKHPKSASKSQIKAFKKKLGLQPDTTQEKDTRS